MFRCFFSLYLFLGCLTLVNAQIKGKVTDTQNNPLAFVNIFIENTYKGTTTNANGLYELNITTPKTYTVVFSYLGYKTVKKTITITDFPYTLNATLLEESVTLSEVQINAEDNPANLIIKNAIAQRKNNLEKIDSYKADFYSRGLIKITNAPEKVLGQEVDLDVELDSTRSGILYLSETISKIQFLRPNKLKEKITASKVSGDDNGFSFNNARDVNFNFYNNTVTFGGENISPIANNAFSYYKYQLSGVFYDDHGNLINKIKVIPKRKNDPVFNGFIYIVENQWTIYALELSITGIQARIPAANVITLKQSFSYSKADAIWALLSQSIDFDYNFFGFKGDGRFTAVYSNYEFNTPIARKTFGKELVAFEAKANKKDSLFWNTIRPVPLTLEERNDYIKKDSIQKLKKSKSYLDSIDTLENKFKLKHILGYTYQNSYNDYQYGYDIPLKSLLFFNTVQGFTAEANVFFRKNFDKYRKYFTADANLQYGFADKRLRATGKLRYKFNDVSESFLTLSGGSEVKQFNNANPISGIGNTISTLLFEENFAKLYERYFTELQYTEELFNGFRVWSSLSFERRQALFNNTNQVIINNNSRVYTSNNPLSPSNFTNAPFNNHNIFKFNTGIQINFGQEYLSYPNSKFNISNDKYPTLVLGYEKGFGATNNNYNFDQIKARLYQSFNIANKGRFFYNLRLGKFFNANDIAFMDFQHFNGNQTPFSLKGQYTNVFNNLEYYRLSTNDSYFEAHAEHDFNGFILGKIPLLNKLNFNFVVGAHMVATPNFKPYQELSIGLDNVGWGKWRFLRIDYVRSYQSGYLNNAIVLGLKFF